MRVNRNIIHATSGCLAVWDVVNPLLAVALTDAVGRVAYSTLTTCAKKRVRQGYLLVYGKMLTGVFRSR